MDSSIPSCASKGVQPLKSTFIFLFIGFLSSFYWQNPFIFIILVLWLVFLLWPNRSNPLFYAGSPLEVSIRGMNRQLIFYFLIFYIY